MAEARRYYSDSWKQNSIRNRLLQQAQELRLRGNHKTAYKVYLQIARQESIPSTQTQINLARCERHLGNIDNAINRLKETKKNKISRHYDDQIKVSFALLNAYLTKYKCTKSKNLLTSAAAELKFVRESLTHSSSQLKHSNETEFLIHTADIYYYEGKKEESVKILKKLLSIRSNDSHLVLQTNIINLCIKLDETECAFNIANELRKNHALEPKTHVDVLHDLIYCAKPKTDLSGVIKELELLLVNKEYEALHPKIELIIAHALRRNQDIHLSEQAYRDIINNNSSLVPESSFWEAHNSLASLLLSNKKCDEVITLLNDMLEIVEKKNSRPSPHQLSRTHLFLANAYFEEGQRPLAIKHCNIARDLDPEYAATYSLKGKLMDSNIKVQRQNFDTSRKLDPNRWNKHHGGKGLLPWSTSFIDTIGTIDEKKESTHQKKIPRSSVENNEVNESNLITKPLSKRPCIANHPSCKTTSKGKSLFLLLKKREPLINTENRYDLLRNEEETECEQNPSESEEKTKPFKETPSCKQPQRKKHKEAAPILRELNNDRYSVPRKSRCSSVCDSMQKKMNQFIAFGEEGLASLSLFFRKSKLPKEVIQEIQKKQARL
ncbi:MAG: hypothetical protein ACD_45C00620G0009 [uncultured bacterium]|nr:MAG: hypothetical protein ACD_45C00620G0009 [uncultured bacterium]